MTDLEHAFRLVVLRTQVKAGPLFPGRGVHQYWAVDTNIPVDRMAVQAFLHHQARETFKQ